MINKIKHFSFQIANYSKKHKIKTFSALIVVLFIGYFTYTNLDITEGETRYILSSVTKGTINTTISGTGQVSVLEKIDIKTETSGDLVYLNIQKDQEVKAGTLLAKINSRDAEKAVWSAEINLENAQLSLKNIAQDTTSEFDDAIEGGLSVLTNTLKELISITPNLEKQFLESSYNGSDNDIDYYLYLIKAHSTDLDDLSYWTTTAEKKYIKMQDDLEFLKNEVWKISKKSETQKIEEIISKSYETTKSLLGLIRQAYNVIQKYQITLENENLIGPISEEITLEQASSLNGFISSLTNVVNNLSTAKSNINDKKESLSKVDVNTKTQDASIKSYEYALADARKELSKHFVYAKLDGIIAEINSDIKTGNTVSSNTLLGNLITKQKIAEITLSEVDIVNIERDNKAILTFDAIEDLTITGKVIEVDSIGSANSGVVSYGVKIAFDVNEEKIKPGMSVNATIITNSKNDALIVPTASIKSQNNSYYVQVLGETHDLTDRLNSIQGVISKTEPVNKNVEVGLSDDSNTEIISGLSEGDQIIVRISSSNTTTNTTDFSRNNTNIMNMGGGMQGRLR
jgi:HlyD family secretion protein